MTWLTLGLRVSTIAVFASTDTVSYSCPTCSTTSTTGLALTCSTMPVCTKVRKPRQRDLQAIRAERRGSAERTSPSHRSRVLRDDAGFGLRRGDVTPGRTPPDWSLTLPLICAVACAQTVEPARRATSRPTESRMRMRAMSPPGIR